MYLLHMMFSMSVTVTLHTALPAMSLSQLTTGVVDYTVVIISVFTLDAEALYVTYTLWIVWLQYQCFNLTTHSFWQSSFFCDKIKWDTY